MYKRRVINITYYRRKFLIEFLPDSTREGIGARRLVSLHRTKRFKSGDVIYQEVVRRGEEKTWYWRRQRGKTLRKRTKKLITVKARRRDPTPLKAVYFAPPPLDVGRLESYYFVCVIAFLSD